MLDVVLKLGLIFNVKVEPSQNSQVSNVSQDFDHIHLFVDSLDTTAVKPEEFVLLEVGKGLKLIHNEYIDALPKRHLDYPVIFRHLELFRCQCLL